MSPPVVTIREHLLAIAGAGLAAVSAERLTASARDLAVASGAASASSSASLSDISRPIVIAAGKPAAAMVRGLLRAGIVPARGIVATTHVPDTGEPLPDTMQLFLAGHPVPTAESEAAGRAALALVREAGPDDRILVLLSGGASALLAAPADGVTLDDKVRATRALLAGGAAIHELNAVRKHLSAIKGGRLAAAARCPVHTLALSDVISPTDDDPAVIGSGPTVPDDSTFGDTLGVIARLGVREAMPPAVLACLEEGAAGRRAESPKPGDPRLSRAAFTLIGSRRDAMTAARAEAERLGYRVIVEDEAVSGEARDAGPRLLARARAWAEAAPFSASGPPLCVIASGETTVRVNGTGRGGRNQEFGLALVDELATLPIVAASIGTDGIDGPTDAAGAIVDATTARRARERGLDPAAFLANNDAYHFFDALGDLIKPGPTDTNVGDLQIMLIYNPGP